MKKLSLFLFSMGVFLSLLFVGCEKAPESDPSGNSNPDKKPTISVSVVPEDGIVDFGGSVTFSFIVSENTKKMTINGQDVSLPVKNFVVSNIVEGSTFVFIVENDAGRTVRTKSISVRGQIFPLPVISVTANPDTLPIGGGIVTIIWTTQNADSVLIDGIWFTEPNGSTQIERDITSDISALAKGKGGETTSNGFIYVLRMDDFLASGTWTYYQGDFTDTLGVFMENFFMWENALPCQRDDTRTFTMNPNISVLDPGVQCSGENIQISIKTWSLNDSILMIGEYTMIHKIILLTKDILVYTISSFMDNGDGTWTPILVKNTYKHLP